MFALLARCVDLFRPEIFIKEVGEVDEVSGFVVSWRNCGMEHQAREVDFIVRSVVALRTREDGGERTTEGFIDRIISEGITCETFVELVLGGVKDRMKVLRSIFLLGGLKIIRQNYNKVSLTSIEFPETSGHTSRHPDYSWNHAIGCLPCGPLFRNMMIFKQRLQSTTNAYCKFALFVIMLSYLIPEHRRATKQLQHRVPVAIIESVVKPLRSSA